MARKRPTVADMRAMKGKRQLTMLRVMTLDEAEAAERAGVDIVSIPPELLLNPQYRDAAMRFFRPEFFNRMDQVVTFRPLKPEGVKAITRRELDAIAKRDPAAAGETGVREPLQHEGIILQ